MNNDPRLNFKQFKFQRKNRVLSIQAANSTKVIQNEKITIDPTLIFQIIAVVMEVKSELKNYLQYELAPFPPSLFDNLWSPRRFLPTRTLRPPAGSGGGSRRSVRAVSEPHEPHSSAVACRTAPHIPPTPTPSAYRHTTWRIAPGICISRREEVNKFDLV